MLHKDVVLANLQVYCPTRDAELNKIAGRIRNLFYAASFPWHEGNLGRVIPVLTFQDFYQEFRTLEDAFNASKNLLCSVSFTVLPFPALGKYPIACQEEKLKNAPIVISAALQEHFECRLRMLRTSLEEEKRFYSSLLDELEKVIEIGLFLKKDINPKLVSRMKKAQAHILQFTSVDIRRSTSVKEDVITYCGALL